MEMVEGPTLAYRIAAGPLTLDEALPIAKQVAEALEAAQERGIIHRDHGKRILLPVPVETDSSPPLTLVTNWTAAMKRWWEC